ncbi:MAG: TRAP transporter substrate-binding protein DctP [Sphingomonadaceae bacterium]
MRWLALLMLVLLGACARPQPVGVTELTYATPYSPGHPFSRADQRWIEFVEKQSGGSLKIRPIWSGALLSADMSMEELRHGVADIGLITPIYVRGGTHLIRLQSGFYSGADSVESQVELYNCLDAADPEIGHELEGLKILAVQGGALPGIITRGKRVKTLDDLRGMRLRAPTELLTVLDSLGADPVNMPMGEVYSSLAKGVLDGVIAPPDTFQALHFAEVSQYYNNLAIPRGAYPARAMGMEVWKRLNKKQRAVLEEGKSVWEEALAEEIRAASQRGLNDAHQAGIVFSDMSEADQKRFDELYLRDARNNARSLERFGIDGMKAFDIARTSVVARDTIRCGGIS